MIGVALGGPAGLGTVMIALTLGLSVSNGQRIVHYGVGRLRAADGDVRGRPRIDGRPGPRAGARRRLTRRRAAACAAATVTPVVAGWMHDADAAAFRLRPRRCAPRSHGRVGPAPRRRTCVDKVDRPPSTARGVHHQALLSSDVARTIEFYQGVLEFPLTELFENRDYVGSTHFFFDIGNGNALAFFDFPGLGLGPYQEVLGGHHHLAISVEREQLGAAQGQARRGRRRDLRRGTTRRSTSPAPMVSDWN